MISASSLRITALCLAVLAGYVTVLSTGPVAANLRLSQLDAVNANFWYSIIAASGALVSAIGFVLFGRLSNRLRSARGSRQPVFVYAAVVLAPAGYLLSVAISIEMIFAMWLLVCLAASAILSTSTAVVLEVIPAHRIGLASGLFGAGAVIALLYGVLVGTLTGNNPQLVLLIGTLTAVALTLPAALMREETSTQEPAAIVESNGKRSKAFLLFLTGTFASMAALAVYNDYFFQIAKHLTNNDLVRAPEYAQGLIATSSASLLVGSLLSGLLIKNGAKAKLWFVGSLLLTAIAILACGIAPNFESVMFAASLGGFAGGANIGAQLPLMKASLGDKAMLGLESGTFNLVSTVPSFAMPALGAVLVSVVPHNWIIVMAAVVAAIALVGAALARLIRIR